MTENQEAVKAVAATQEAAAEQKEEAVNPNLRTLEVTIDGKEFQDGVTKELRRLSKKAKMPGFRPGHVPFAMVEAMYGQQASAEVINKLLEREANKAMREGQYRVVGQFDAKPLAPAEGSSDLRFAGLTTKLSTRLSIRSSSSASPSRRKRAARPPLKTV